MFLSIYTILSFTSCINEIESEVSPGTIPIKFATKVSNINTRVTDTAFEKGDRAGLYAMLSSTPISEARYINNLWLELGENSTFIPEKTIFYPEGDATLDLISYYPYQTAKIPVGESSIPVSVQADQSNTGNRSLSDFLIATEKNVASSEEAVLLKYKHMFTKIKIAIIPNSGEDIEKMHNANPRIIATGFHTKAEYDTKTNSFTNRSKEADIIPYGEWDISNGSLTGKEFIIIPQEANSQKQAFVMEWNGKIYTCPMPQLTIKEGTQCTINITAMQTTSDTFTGIVSKVEDWTKGEEQNTDNKGGITVVHLAALSFAQSNIYRVYHKGKPMAEICKEYLKSDVLASRAIVVYPVGDDEISDLSQGVVLKLQDEGKDINGGIIKWDVSGNTFTYTQGQSQPIDKFYLNTEGKIQLEEPENPISMDIVSHTIKDIRKGNINEYPIVKIGTQYWMRKDLRAITYRNGAALSKQISLGQGAGYFKPENSEIYLYNGESILEEKLAPTGWKIPNADDWGALKAYTANDASLLKAGKWEALKAEETVCEVSNLTGFGAYPVGTWDLGKHAYEHQLTGYWTQDDTNGSIPAQTLFFIGGANTFSLGGSHVEQRAYYKALSIRCLKE